MKFKLNISPFARALLIGSLALSASACHYDDLVAPEEPIEVPEPEPAPINTPPTITSSAVVTGTVGVAYSYTLTATDADEDTLDWSSVTLPTWGAFDTSTGILSGTPDLADSYDVELMVSDGTDAVAQAFTIVVTEATSSGTELLTNGDFEDGATAWTGADTAIVTDGGNSFFEVDVVTAGNVFDVNLSQSMTLIPDTAYVLTFKAKGSVARTMLAGLGLFHDPWTNITESVALTTEWQTFTYTITTTGFGDDDSRVLFDMGGEVGVVSIDDVSVSLADSTPPAPVAELLTNGDFEDGVTAWSLPGDNADTVVTDAGNSFFQVDVETAGNVFDVNLSQSMTLIPDTAYVLSFKAKGSVTRTMLAGLGLFHDPWTNVTESVALTTEWQTFTYTITTTGFGDDDSRVLFDMGGEVGVVSIDDVSVSVSTTSSGGTGAVVLTVDFETDGLGDAYTWTTFENDDNPAVQIVANPDATGANTSATVAQFTARQTGNPWAGTETAHGDFGPVTLDSTNSIIKIMVYKTVISDVGIKFAIASGGAQPEIKVANTLVNQWEELTFDFSGNIGATESINIDQLIVFPDFNLDGRTSDTVSYFDNITLGN